MVVASGNNYGRGLWFIVQGYNATTLITRITSTDLTLSSTSFRSINVNNAGGGSIAIRFYRLP